MSLRMQSDDTVNVPRLVFLSCSKVALLKQLYGRVHRYDKSPLVWSIELVIF